VNRFNGAMENFLPVPGLWSTNRQKEMIGQARKHNLLASEYSVLGMCDQIIDIGRVG
jgi:hypothetical protein